MLQISNEARIGMIALVSALIMGLGAGAAMAACQPGQIQEANLAYQSASQFLDAKQWDQAIARLESIVGVCPEHVPANRGIGAAFYGKGDYGKAIEWYGKVIEIRGTDSEAGDFANLAKAYAKVKQYKEARAEYMKAEQRAPDDCGVLFNLGVMHYAAGYNVESVETLEHALEVCPHLRDRLVKQLATSATAAAKQQKRAGNNERAAFYENLANQYGSAAGGSTVSAKIREKMVAKDYAGAAALAEQTLASNPEQPGIWLSMARCKDAMADRNGAVEAYKQYLALKPNDVRETATLIQVLAEAGRYDEAIATARAAEQKFAPQGRKVLGQIWYMHGMALELSENYEGALNKYTDTAGCGESEWAARGRDGQTRMENTVAYENAKKKKAQQGR